MTSSQPPDAESEEPSAVERGVGSHSGSGQARIPRAYLALPVTLYLAVLVAFFLPFISVSCEGRETASLTGVELVFEGPSAIEWVDSGPDLAEDADDYERGRRNVETAVEDFSGKARFAFVLTFALLGVAIVNVVVGGRVSLAWVLFFAGPFGFLAFVPLLAGSGVSIGYAPTIEHHGGVGATLGLSAIAMLFNGAVLKFSLEANNEESPFPWWGALLGLLGILVFSFLVFWMSDSSFNSDWKWEQPPPTGSASLGRSSSHLRCV